MAYARLRIKKNLEGEYLAGGAIVDVRRLEKGCAPGIRVTRTMVPMGENANGAEGLVTLDPGTYEFTVILPSGDVLSEVAEIDTRAGGVPVIFEMGHSAHEWMSWQHALGNVAGGEALRVMHMQDMEAPWPIASEVNAEMFSIAQPQGSAELTALDLASYLAHTTKSSWNPTHLNLQMHALGCWNHEPPYKMYRIPLAYSINYDAPTFKRHYVLLSNKTDHILCVLPYPWRKANGNEALVELLVGPDQSFSTNQELPAIPWSVSTIARDDNVASVLSYFAAGDDSAATFMATAALDLLFDKMVNPFAASAGAHVLVDQWLREGDTNPRSAHWLQWIDNLANWFPWLPDGEILRGWIALAGRSKTRSVETARGAFIAAEKRGIPVYTAGLRRLVDGLARIANQDKADGREDQAVVEALARARTLAWCADPRFPFTTIRWREFEGRHRVPTLAPRSPQSNNNLLRTEGDLRCSR